MRGSFGCLLNNGMHPGEVYYEGLNGRWNYRITTQFPGLEQVRSPRGAPPVALRETPAGEPASRPFDGSNRTMAFRPGPMLSRDPIPNSHRLDHALDVTYVNRGVQGGDTRCWSFNRS